ncbi:MAG: SUMF1/EgtB/PvdO family nonheme iron enzyme, partial [Verrucomicrobiota bacterium]
MRTIRCQRCLRMVLLLALLAGGLRMSAAATNTVVFLETMATNAVKPWPGSGCNNPWTVAFSVNNPFEQNLNANYGSGNPNGLSFKSGTTNLSDSTITTTLPIDARGNSATLTFYLQVNITSSNAGWAMQLNPGTGFTTRLSGQVSSTQNWQIYTYNLQPSDLVSNLTLRFEFSEGNTGNRIFLDQIVLTSITGTSNAIIPFSAQFVRIPSGNFLMGDQFGYIDLKHYTDEIPVHNVYISPFYMATTLATCREYCDYLNSALTNGSIEVRTNIVYAVGGTNVFFYTHDASSSSRIQFQNNSFTVLNSRDLHPVTSVRWFGAIAFCNWLSQLGGFDSCYNITNGDVDLTKNGFRLPTEAEWEYAAHGGQTNPYVMFPWGMNTNANGTFANWENSYDPFESTNDYPCTTPVGFYNGALRLKSDYNWPGSQLFYQTSDGSNPFGLYDMGGNVWEWCNDWYMNTYYAYCTNNNIVTNPPGPTYAQADLFPSNSAPGAVAYRCLRGGTWWNGNSASDFDYGHARVSNRDPSYFLGGGPPGDPYGEWSQTGFRVMRREMIPQTVGLFTNLPGVQPGYTLMSPMQGTDTYLLNNFGQYVHKWTSRFNPGRADYLLENGHLMRACAIPQTVI